MQFSWQALIDRARLYVDDDHQDNDGWIDNDDWLVLAQVEYADLYRKWVRMGLVVPAATDTSFTGPTKSLSGVLAIVGVAENLGTYKRLLTPATSSLGAYPYWQGETGSSTSWTATGAGDTVLVTLDPADSSGNYVVRWVPTVAYATDATATIELPYGGDERLVLGMARRSHLKDASNSQLLNGLIAQSDAELAFAAWGKTGKDSPRVRRVPPSVKTRMQQLDYPANPSFWTYL